MPTQRRKKSPQNRNRSSALEHLIATTTKTTFSPERSPEETPPPFLHTSQNTAAIVTTEQGFVFSYWDIDHSSLQKAIEQLGPSSKLFLRFFDVSTTTDIAKAKQWDLEIYDRSGNWYLKLDHPKQRLCFEVGIKNRDGKFRPLLRSNVMSLKKNNLVNDVSFTKSVDPAFVTEISPKRLFGPYFYELFEQGRLHEIVNSSLEAIFHDLQSLLKEAGLTS